MKSNFSLLTLNQDELLQIHEASMELLSKTGIMMFSQKALKFLCDAGAQVDTATNLVKIPKCLIEESLDSLPREIAFYETRKREKAFLLGDGKTHAVTDGDTIFVLDSESGKRRKVTKSDVEQFTKIADALANINMILVPGQPQDVCPEATVLHGLSAVFNNTHKPVFLPLEGLSITRAVIEMTKVVAEEENLAKHPILICEFSPTSPLTWLEGTIDPLIEVAKSGIPCGILSMPLTGVSAPYTIAGQIALYNAEMLSGIVISQIARKGAPVVYAQAWTTFDMKTSKILFASPETVLSRIAGTQLAKYYKIPCTCEGFDTDSPYIDVQNGWENFLPDFLHF